MGSFMGVDGKFQIDFSDIRFAETFSRGPPIDGADICFAVGAEFTPGNLWGHVNVVRSCLATP